MTGIRDISADDITFAQELGYKIKLLGIAQDYEGQVLMTVEPCLVPLHAPLAAIEDVYNAVFIEGNFVETPLLTGRGAGQKPTASAVVADIVDLARGLDVPAFGVCAKDLKACKSIAPEKACAPYYLRLSVLDQPGVLADVSAILRDHAISIESLIQHGHDPGQPVSIILTTHRARFGDIKTACDLIENLECSVAAPHFMRIESEL